MIYIYCYVLYIIQESEAVQAQDADCEAAAGLTAHEDSVHQVPRRPAHRQGQEQAA